MKGNADRAAHGEHSGNGFHGILGTGAGTDRFRTEYGGGGRKSFRPRIFFIEFTLTLRVKTVDVMNVRIAVICVTVRRVCRSEAQGRPDVGRPSKDTLPARRENRTFLPPALPDNLRNPARQGSRNARRQSRSGIFRTIRREEDRRYPDRPRERLQSPFEAMGRTQDERHAPDHAGEQDSPRPVYQTGRPLRSATGHQQPPTDPLSQLHRRRKHPRNPRDAGLVGRRPDRHDPRSLDDPAST